MEGGNPGLELSTPMSTAAAVFCDLEFVPVVFPSTQLHAVSYHLSKP